MIHDDHAGSQEEEGVEMMALKKSADMISCVMPSLREIHIQS